ncbi:hypothetical protein [Sphingomonas sp.]|uniref:hypothetical protein n=1 Tax=Sphingomonas sp. TaxID=28214 RepID=UPI000DB6305E|nr:hypothetical protein [Sphingomonas sp.]PZU08753.1 MAG: hypothetical protein DI605_12545 [Sphingomonas sp.]
MDLLRQIRIAQDAWIARGFGVADLQGMNDARTLLSQAIADQNETMIRIYSETCLLLLEANRKQAAEWMAMMMPDCER